MEKVDIIQSTEEVSTDKKVKDVVMDLSIEGATREQFRINGRDDKILELNTTDLGIMARLKEGYDKLNQIMDELKNINIDGDDVASADSIQKALDKADKEMRKTIDWIFDSNVSEVCCGNGTMYDPRDGKFRWEIIIESLVNLYHNNLSREYEKMKSRVTKYTDQYTSKRVKSATKPKRNN